MSNLQLMINAKAQMEFKAFASKCSDFQILCEFINSKAQVTLAGKDTQGNQHKATAQIARGWFTYAPSGALFVAALIDTIRVLLKPGPVIKMRRYLLDRIFVHGLVLHSLEWGALVHEGIKLLRSSGDGMTEENIRAFALFHHAAKAGHTEAPLYLGICYSGGDGVAKDYAEALKWYRKGAEQGDARCQCSLGLCYEMGEGVKKDYVEAYAWMNLAARRSKAERRVRDALERKMSQQQVAAAQKRTKELRAEIDAKGWAVTGPQEKPIRMQNDFPSPSSRISMATALPPSTSGKP